MPNITLNNITFTADEIASGHLAYSMTDSTPNMVSAVWDSVSPYVARDQYATTTTIDSGWPIRISRQLEERLSNVTIEAPSEYLFDPPFFESILDDFQSRRRARELREQEAERESQVIPIPHDELMRIVSAQ